MCVCVGGWGGGPPDAAWAYVLCGCVYVAILGVVINFPTCN